jgi:endonuclease YncB( thermonuclease family)
MSQSGDSLLDVPVLRYLVCAVLLLGNPVPALAGEPFVARVTKVIDGDSLVVEVKSRKMEIRLYGVDSPEYDQPFSGLAKAFSRRAVLGRQVTIDPRSTDRYDRVVALVDRDGGMLNADLVSAGFAWVSPRYCRLRLCREWRELEMLARSKRAGLWQEADPVPPWRWKEMSREKSFSRFSSKN